MFKRSLAAALASFLLFVGGALYGKAAAPVENDIHRITDSFQQMMDLSLGTFLAPTVVELVFPPEAADTNTSQFGNDVIIVNTSKNTLEPSYGNHVTLPAHKFAPVFVVSAPEAGVQAIPGTALYDKNPASYVELALPENGVGGTVVITMTTPVQETLSGFTFSLDDNVVSPTRVRVVASVDGEEKTVLSPVAVSGRQISFPRTAAREWKITFWYNQPLRISELSFFVATMNLYERHVKFLAQPGEGYRLYVGPEQRVSLPIVAVAYNLSNVTPAVSVPVENTVSNPYYRPADTDADGVSDKVDNCPNLANPGQEDVNGNGMGDVCEDFDKDGWMNSVDNCPNLPNPGQQDTDSDGIGDQCDTEESRFTERHAWVPWAGMGMAAVVLVALFALTVRKGIKDGPEELS